MEAFGAFFEVQNWLSAPRVGERDRGPSKDRHDEEKETCFLHFRFRSEDNLVP